MAAGSAAIASTAASAGAQHATRRSPARTRTVARAAKRVRVVFILSVCLSCVALTPPLANRAIRYAQAVTHIEECLKLSREAYGENHPRLAESLTWYVSSKTLLYLLYLFAVLQIAV